MLPALGTRRTLRAPPPSSGESLCRILPAEIGGGIGGGDASGVGAGPRGRRSSGALSEATGAKTRALLLLLLCRQQI